MIKTINTKVKGVCNLLGLNNGQIATGFQNGTIQTIGLDNDKYLSKTRVAAYLVAVSSLTQLPNENLVSCGLNGTLEFGVTRIKNQSLEYL